MCWWCGRDGAGLKRNSQRVPPVMFQPRAIPATLPTRVGMLQDIDHTQSMPNNADICLWTQGEDSEDDDTIVHAMLDTPEAAEEPEEAEETQEEYEEGRHLYWMVTGQLD